MEQAARDARSASLPILRPAGTAALLGTGLESGPGRREGTDILVSTHSTPCLMCPGRWGHARAAGCLLVGFVQWGCQPPGRPKNRLSSQQCCAVPAVLHCSVGSALRQAWQLSWQPCSCAVGWYLSKAELHALGPHSRELPRRPKGLPWLHQDVATVLPHLWHLSAAVCSLSPAPWTLAPDKPWGRTYCHSLWEQMPPSWGHAATQLLLPRVWLWGSQRGDSSSWFSVPEAPEGAKLAVWPGLVATRIRQYNAWQRDQHGAGGAEGMAVTGPPPQPNPREQVGAELNQGNVGQGTWGHCGVVSYGALLGQSRGSPGLAGHVVAVTAWGRWVSLCHAMALLHVVPGEERAAAMSWYGLGMGLWRCRSTAVPSARSGGCCVAGTQLRCGMVGFDLCQRIVRVCLAYLARREIRFSALAPPPFVRRSPARACPALRFKFRARLGGAGLGVLHPVGCTEPRCPSATGCGHRTGALGPLYAGCRYAGQCGCGHSELMSHGGLALHAPERDRLWHVGDTSTGAERGFRGLSLHREVCRADADPQHRLYPHRLRAGGGRT